MVEANSIISRYSCSSISPCHSEQLLTDLSSINFELSRQCWYWALRSLAVSNVGFVAQLYVAQLRTELRDELLPVNLASLEQLKDAFVAISG